MEDEPEYLLEGEEQLPDPGDPWETESPEPPSSAEYRPRGPRQPRKKWRTGPPPPAPQFIITWADVYRKPRCYERYVKEVEMWLTIARHHRPLSELAILLYNEVKGDGKDVIREIPNSQLINENGVANILKALTVFKEMEVVQVGDLLGEYEDIQRQPGEMLASYVSYFRDVELRLRNAKLPVLTGETRAYKLLKTACLDAGVQRQILVTCHDVRFR